MRRPLTIILCTMILPLAGCFEDPADEPVGQDTSGSPPAQICAQVKNVLDAMRDKGAIDYQDDGSAVTEEAIWMGMGDEGRDKVGQALSFHAACMAKAGSASQRIVIRNPSGNVMMQRNFDTRINAMSMFGD